MGLRQEIIPRLKKLSEQGLRDEKKRFREKIISSFLILLVSMSSSTCESRWMEGSGLKLQIWESST